MEEAKELLRFGDANELFLDSLLFGRVLLLS